MTRAESDKIAALVAAHWPAPALTPWDREALARALADVPAADALAAVEALVREGREFQPRAPHILAAVAEVREVRAASRGLTPAEPHPSVREAERRLLASAEEAARGMRSFGSLRGPLGDLVRRALPPAPPDLEDSP